MCHCALENQQQIHKSKTCKFLATEVIDTLDIAEFFNVLGGISNSGQERPFQGQEMQHGLRPSSSLSLVLLSARTSSFSIPRSSFASL